MSVWEVDPNQDVLIFIEFRQVLGMGASEQSLLFAPPPSPSESQTAKTATGEGVGISSSLSPVRFPSKSLPSCVRIGNSNFFKLKFFLKLLLFTLMSITMPTETLTE